MRIILPGLEGVEYTRYAFQQYTNRIAHQVGVSIAVVSDRQARTLFKIIVEDALAMGMTTSAARMMCQYTETVYTRFMDEFFAPMGVQVSFEDAYTDVFDELVLAQWQIMEPYLSGAVPYNVDVQWLGTNILVHSDVRGPHHAPRRKRKPALLDAGFTAANKVSCRQRALVLSAPGPLVQERTLPRTTFLQCLQRYEADQDYAEGHFDKIIDELLNHHDTNP